jgi:hypothetical protein
VKLSLKLNGLGQSRMQTGNEIKWPVCTEEASQVWTRRGILGQHPDLPGHDMKTLGSTWLEPIYINRASSERISGYR